MKRTNMLLTLLLLTGLTSCAVRDLRSKTIQENGISKAEYDKGSEILEMAISAHGGHHQWSNTQAISFNLYDKWNDPVGKSLAMPIAANKTNSKWLVTGDLQSISIEFLDGKHKGEHWGIENDHVITTSDNTVSDRQQEKGLFYWRAIPYFLMTPYMLTTADVIFYMGEEQLEDGHLYEKVFISWNTASPQEDIDQWVLYVDKDSHMLTYADHTLREMVKFLKATAEFSNYTNVNGLLIPEKVDIKFKAEGSFVGHEMTFSQIEIDDTISNQTTSSN